MMKKLENLMNSSCVVALAMAIMVVSSTGCSFNVKDGLEEMDFSDIEPGFDIAGDDVDVWEEDDGNVSTEGLTNDVEPDEEDVEKDLTQFELDQFDQVDQNDVETDVGSDSSDSQDGEDGSDEEVDVEIDADTDDTKPVCTEDEDCDDGNACTDDFCEPVEGCVYEDNTLPCDDGNACTEEDSCSDGECHAGQIVNCNDDNACTDDSCDSQFGCVYEDVDCNDGDLYTTDHCEPVTGCLHETVECIDVVDCNDDNACTDDSCDEENGFCIFEPNSEPCNDGNACTTGDVCGDDSCQSGDELDCDDNNPFTYDFCNSETGECAHECIPQCEGLECGDDGCEGSCGDCPQDHICIEGFCEFVPKCTDEECDDGNFCNGLEICNPQVGCQDGVPLVCDDGNPCTADVCYFEIGCTKQLLPNCCLTGDECDDGNPCTNDKCVNNKCTHEAVKCNDNNVCNGEEVCDWQIGCQSGMSLVCKDNNLCTDDICNPQTGCVYTDIPDVCDDSNICTDDVCHPTEGCSHTDVNCDDGDPCNIDSCNTQIGCIHVVIDNDCDGWSDGQDNCPNNFNPNQEDIDKDGVGDSCDPEKNCVATPNPSGLPVDFFTIVGCVTACTLPANGGTACLYLYPQMQQQYPGECGVDSDGDGTSEWHGDCNDSHGIKLFECWNQSNPPASWINSGGSYHPTACVDWTVTIQ